MTALDTFFADIGAGGLSTAVVAPAPGTQGPATQLYGRLQEEINGVNDKTLSLLKDNWNDFKGQLKEGDELIKRLEEEERELKDLEDVGDGPDAFLPPLIEQLASHQSLSAAHLLTTTSITLLSALLTFHTTTHALGTATTSGDLPAAVDALRSVTSAVEEGAEDWIEETDVWKSLVRWAGEEESRLESALLSALESCSEISPASTTNSQTATLTLRERVAAAPGGPQLAVSTLFEAMEEFATVTGRKAQGEGVLQRLAKGMVRYFVAPFLEANGGPAGKAGDEAKKVVKPRLAFTLEEEKEEGVHVVYLSPAEENAPVPKAEDTLTDLSSFLAFFSAHSSLFPSNGDETPSKYATTLTAHLTPPLQSHLISSHLSPSLPSSTATLPTYLSLLDAASKFESTFLPEHHYFAFLPFRTRSGGREVEEQRVIRSWAQRVPNHWAKAVGDEALARIRTAVKGWDWGEGETVEVEVKEEEEMMGLLLGLGMGGDEDGKGTEGSGKGPEGGKKPGQLALETVPKGAKREMTIEEATAPKPPRPKTPSRQPTPPPTAPPAVVAEPEPTPVLAPAPTGGKRGKLGAARIAPSVLPPRSPSPPPLFQGGDAPLSPSADDAPSAAPASLPVPSENTSTISLLSSSLSSPTSPDANLAATSTFSLLEKPLTSPSEMETTADLAPDEEVSRPHQYGSSAVRDGLEAAKKEDAKEEVKEEVKQEVKKEEVEDQEDKREEEEDRKPFIKQESVEPDPQGAPSESMLFGGRGDVGASPSFSPRVDVPPEQEREVKEESVEPEVPPSQPATSFSAPLATAAHSPPAATNYSPPATTEVQQPEYGGYEPTPYQPPSPAQPVETFEQEEAEQGEEAAPYEPSRYEPTPYQPPAPYEPTPYQPPEPETVAEEQQQPKEEEQDDEVAPYEATSYEPTPYHAPAKEQREEKENVAPYEVEPYQPTPYEPTPYEPPADAVPDEAEQQYGGEPKEENDVAPYDPTPYQPSAYEPTPYREPTPPAQEEPVAQPEEEEQQQQAYEPEAYQPHSYEPSSGYEPAAYESSGYQPEQQEQEKQAFEPGHQAFPSTASDDEYERAMREWQPSPAAQPENQQDSTPASSSTYESNAYQSSSYEPSAYEQQQEYQPEQQHEPEQQVQPKQPQDSHYQYGQQYDQSAQSWQPASSPYDPPQQAASPAAPPVPVIVSPPPVLPPQPASAAAAPPPPRASAGFSSARPAVQQQRRVISPSVASPASQPQNAYAPPSPVRATPPRSTYPLSGPIFRPPSRPSSAQSQNNGPVLNHIQQRFASPPPGNHNPYVPLGVLAGGPPPQQQTPGGSYLPLNDPLFAGLLGSGSGSKPASSGNYFTPDPPGARLHRSGSVSSQTSNSSFSMSGAAGGGYRPSSSASNSRSPVGGYAPPQHHQQYQPPQQQQHYQPQQQHAYNAHSYNPNAYASQGGGGYGVQEEMEELQDSYANGYGGQQQPYNPYAYGAKQPAMRLRGGAYLSDSEDEDEEEEDEWDGEDAEEEDRPVMRLRGGADLGDMDDDDGNRSADDWGFGDDAGTGDVEEDAWGFGDENEDASAPSPPPAPALVKAPAAPPARALASATPPVPTVPSHAPSASITSTTSSTGSLSRSRPPSYAFSPSLAPPPLPSSAFGGEVDEADEEGAGGDEWGFGDEELEAPSPAVEEPVEAAVPPPRETTPPPPSPPPPAPAPGPPLPAPTFSSPPHPQPQPVQPVLAFQPEPEPETVSPVEDVVDDWGFGAEDDAAPLEPVEEAQVVAEEPSDMLEYERAIEEHDEVHEDPPKPTVADEVVRTEEAPVEEEEQVDQEPFSAPEPISAVRQPSPPPQEPISSVEAEPEPAAEDEGWGLDEEAADEAEPEQNEASVEEHAAPLVGAMEAQAPVISSPPLDTPSEVPSPVVPTRDLALDAFPLGTTETLPAEPDEPAPVEPAFTGVEFEVQPVEEAAEEPSPAAEAAEEPTAPSALTAPAAELTDPFPIEPKVEAPRLPTPQIPAPLPHHDVAEASIVEPQSTEEALQGIASAELDDANLFEADQPEDDGLGLDGEENEAVPSDLAPVESFLPDGKEAATQEHDVPIETSLLNPEPAMEDFADFTPVEQEDDNVPLRSPFQTQAAWEPFEEPSGVPVGAAAQPSPVHEDDEPLAPEEREAALNRAERLIEEEATVPNMARKELHELAATYPPTASSSSREPSDPSIATREGTMSSPEVIEHSDAWGFDGDSAPAPAEGAEVLEASPAEPAVHDGEQDSVVQHEYDRPALHDESAVEHVAHRPLVQPEDKDAAIVLPAHDAHPQERTFSPPPESVPAPAEEDDASGWDLGEEDTPAPLQEAVEPEPAHQVEQAEEPASTAEEDWDFGSQQLDAPAAEVLEAVETPAEEPAPPPASESAVQHISQRDVEPAEHSSMSPPLPVELAQPQQHTFSPSPSSLPAEEPYSAEAQQEPTAGEGWDFDASQADVPAAEMLESTQASVEDAAPPPSDESAVQHISQRGVEQVEHDATSSPLPVELAQPQQHTFSPPPSALPAEEPLPAEPQQEEEPAAAADEGRDFDAQQDDLPAAAEALESPQTAVEEAAPPPPAQSAVQHISQRPVEPVEPAPVSPPLPAQLAQPQEHTFSPPPSAVPADDDAFADDPWDLDPVEPTPVSERPAAAEKHAPSAFAEETQMVKGEPEVEQQREEDSWNSGEQNEAAEVLEAEPEEQVMEEVPPPPPADESAVQHEQDRPIVETAPEETAARAVQPQEHTFDIPPSAAPAEESLARALSPQPPSPPPEETPTEDGGDDGWGWDGEAAEEQAYAEPVSAVEAAPILRQHVDKPVPRPASPPPPSFAAPPRAPSPPPVAPRSPSPPPPAAATAASPVSLLATTAPPPPRASAVPRVIAEPAPSAPAPPTESAEADEWGWNDDAEDDSSKPTQPAPPAQQPAAEEVPKEVQPEEPEEPSPPPIRREKMMVSKRSKEIVKIAEEVLLEALKVASPSFEHPEFASATAPLLQTFVSLLSLYRATAAVHNSNLLASVPAIGMQFANDADWIGREVERIWREATEGKQLQVSEDQAMDVELAIQSTRQLGKDTRSKQVSIQRAALMESLDEAGGFLRTSDDSRYSACERGLQQVTHTLQRLALVWKPVMTPTALYTTLGGLINEVLLRILDEIEDQDDISEEESIRLNALCKMLHELESLFEGSETSVGREVPVWFKFVFLSELLEASMADIMFLFSEQHLLDFTPQEIAKLMRALFADSALRNRNIEKVLQGHPTAAPDEGGDGW